MKHKPEQRSRASRVYRIFCLPFVKNFAAAMVICGWALALFGSTASIPVDTTNHVEFVVWLGGAVLVFTGCTAGFVAWVMNPALDRRFHDHILNGASEHKDLLSEAKYERRHDELVTRVSELTNTIGRLAERLKLDREERNSGRNN